MSGSNSNRDIGAPTYKPGQEPDTIEGFAKPALDFEIDDSLADRVRDLYRQTEGSVANPTGSRVDVEQEGRNQVEGVERQNGRKVTEEERKKIMEKVRNARGGSWLQGAKEQLVGETVVPIEWFNRLVAENERSIGFLADRMAERQKEREESDNVIANLQKENEELKAGKQPVKGSDAEGESESLKAQLGEANEEIKKLNEVNSNLLEKAEEKNRAHIKTDQQLFDTVEKLEEMKRLLAAAEAHTKAGENSDEDSGPTPPSGSPALDATTSEAWIAAVADKDNLIQWWNAVDELRQSSSALEQRVLKFYEDLKYTDGREKTAAEALDVLTEFLSNYPIQKDPAFGKIYTFSLLSEINILKMSLANEKFKSENLERQLELTLTDDGFAKSIDMRYEIYQDEEIDRRVDSQTQGYREHRRDLLGHIMNAGTAMQEFEASQTDQQIREAIAAIRQRWLSIATLPEPRHQEPRKPRGWDDIPL
ncbi:hypothetical protein M426DRAFT_258135 [Hypoxylon sp. CI-4A]|nr:hypothetical protein M426DRAFT_258135 [Hypoxylon sp. CI-4A]